MNKFFRFSLSTLLILMVGCDPGMSIRQTSDTGNETKPGLAIRVATTHPLIGETHYSAKIEIRNSGASPVILTGAELVAHGTTYANNPPPPTPYPIELRAWETATVGVRFDLAEPVYKAFKGEASLRVHYTVAGKEQISVATLLGGALNE